MKLPANLYYTREHEWLKAEGARVTVGITDFAQAELGDVVYIELVEPGARIAAGQRLATVESVKAVSDVYAPVGGIVAAVNPALADAPEIVNQDPYTEGWFAVIEPLETLPDGLLNSEAYAEFIGGKK